MDNQQRPYEGLRELALFAGAGGGILGGKLLGWKTVCAVEIEPYAASVLVQRQNDGILPPFPIWDDVCTFDGRPWRGVVDVVSGGFPCQDISCAGKGDGLDGARSGLWKEMRRIIGEVRPAYVFVENSPMLPVRGIEQVLGDMATLGYSCAWGTFSGRHVGAPIERERLFIACSEESNGEAWLGHIESEGEVFGAIGKQCPSFWLQAPSVSFGMEHGLDSYMDQVAAIGNGQVPAVAALAWKILYERMMERERRTV